MQPLFPGLLLGEITTETYKVPEVPENGRVKFFFVLFTKTFLACFVRKSGEIER